MNYVKFTSYSNGKPLWVRSDQIASWYFDRGHYHIVPLFDDIDIEVKETGEEILGLVTGSSQSSPAMVSVSPEQRRRHIVRRPRQQ